MALPSDPMILLSYVNTKLRDRYDSLSELCEDLDTEQEALIASLAAVGVQYDKEKNQFR